MSDFKAAFAAAKAAKLAAKPVLFWFVRVRARLDAAAVPQWRRIVVLTVIARSECALPPLQSWETSDSSHRGVVCIAFFVSPANSTHTNTYDRARSS